MTPLSEPEMALLRIEFNEKMLREFKEWMEQKINKRLEEYRELRDNTSSMPAIHAAYNRMYSERKTLEEAYEFLRGVY